MANDELFVSHFYLNIHTNPFNKILSFNSNFHNYEMLYFLSIKITILQRQYIWWTALKINYMQFYGGGTI